MPPNLLGKRFLIAGLSRLTVRVSTLLVQREADVTVLLSADAAPPPDGAALRARLPDEVHLVEGDSLEDALARTTMGGLECFLALADDDLMNLAAAVTCHALDPDVPVVLRAYDISLADQLERGLNIRRAYSVSVLSAPAFLAAGLGSKVLESLRLGDTQVPLWEQPVLEGSPLIGRTPEEAGAATGGQVIARTRGDGAGWRSPAAGSGPLQAGERVVVGGPIDCVVALALAGSRLFAKAGNDRRARRAARRERRSAAKAARKAGGAAVGTLLPVAAAVLAVFLVTTIVVFGVALHKNPIDAIYFAISTALGNSTLDESDAWLKVVGVVAMLAGGALLGVVFSYLASVATTVRIEERMGRQAQRMSGHAVVAGLGSIGYRIGRLLHESGIQWTAIDRAPDDRHAEAAGADAPVLTGDVRLPDNLERAGIRDAACLFACTDSDLANIEACLQAKRLNPSIRTVARIFDDSLASRVSGVFGIDAAVSATHVAAAAFVGAAVDERARRPFMVGDVEHVAFRWDVDEDLTPERQRALRDAGLEILARRRDDGSVQPNHLDDPIERGTVVVVAGTRAGIESTLLQDARLVAPGSVSLDQE